MFGLLKISSSLKQIFATTAQDVTTATAIHFPIDIYAPLSG